MWIGRIHRIFPLLVVFLIAAPARGADETEVQTGTFKIQFEERFDGGRLKNLFRLLPVLDDADSEERAKLKDYDIRDVTFHIDVPESYDGKTAHGILVDYGSLVATAKNKPLLAEFRLIRITADLRDAGMQMNRWYAAGLALDGVFNVARRYKINRRRIYTTGHFGVDAAFLAPDAFRGVIASVGRVPFYGRIENPRTDEALTKHIKEQTPPSTFNQVRTGTRFIFYRMADVDEKSIDTGPFKWGYQRYNFDAQLIVIEDDSKRTARGLLRLLERR